MRDYVTLGGTPCDEDCAQVGSEDYRPRALKECTAFKMQLIRMFGTPPNGASLITKSFPHDFGSYHEVVVTFDSDAKAAVDYAYKLEAEAPTKWDEEARKELGL